MGSKPCPTCGTLNSVTATVCHKCGSLMRETRPPGGGGAVVAGAPTRRGIGRGSDDSSGGGSQAAPYGTPGTATPGTESIPRRVIQKPGGPGPVVQKRVIKKPMEGQEGEASDDSSSGNQSEDDL